MERMLSTTELKELGYSRRFLQRCMFEGCPHIKFGKNQKALFPERQFEKWLNERMSGK